MLLTSDSVSALLQASITGAGLVLAIYGVIIPLSRSFSMRRIRETTDELDKHDKFAVKYIEKIKQVIPNLEEIRDKEKLKKEISKVDPRLLQEMSRVFKYDMWLYLKCTFPKYLILGAEIALFGYVFSTLACLLWIMDYGRSFLDFLVPSVFALSTIVFLAIGALSIWSIDKTMEKEFKRILEERMWGKD